MVEAVPLPCKLGSSHVFSSESHTRLPRRSTRGSAKSRSQSLCRWLPATKGTNFSLGGFGCEHEDAQENV